MTTPIPNGYPVAERRENVVAVRATSELFQFFSTQAPQLVSTLFPTGTTISVPPVCDGSTNVCCGSPTPMCRVNFDVRTLNVTPAPTSSLKVATQFKIKTLDKIPVSFKRSIFNVKCNVSLDTAKVNDRTDGDRMRVDTEIKFSIDPDTKNTRIEIGDTKVDGIDDGDLTLESGGGLGFVCSAIDDIGTVKSSIINAMQDLIASQAKNALTGQGCMKCMQKSDCNGFANECKAGVCTKADGKTCIVQLGVEQQSNIGATLGNFSTSGTGKLDLLAALGGYATADTGLSLGVIGGAKAAEHNNCVPVADPPALSPVSVSPTYLNSVLPGLSTPFHLGIGVHSSYLNQIAFAAWDSGAICAQVGTTNVSLLNTGTIGVLMPSLNSLVSRPSPMYLVVRPQKPPTFVIGKGTTKTNGAGQTVIDDPLLTAAIPDFAMDFYAFINEHFVRVATIQADVRVPIALEVDSEGQIIPVLGDLGKAFTGLRVSNTQLLADDPQSIANSFQTLLGMVTSFLPTFPGVTLPAFSGFVVKPRAFTSTDPDSQGTNQFLGIFADLAGTSGTSLVLPMETQATVAHLTVPPTAAFARSHDATPPELVLTVQATGAVAARPEYSYRVDDSNWSLFSSVTELHITHPLLWLQGRHTVEVRARQMGIPESLDRTPARVEFVIDTEAPRGMVTYNTASHALDIDAWDVVSPVSALQYRVRLADGQITNWFSENHFSVADANRLPPAVQVRDEIGNLAWLSLQNGAEGGSQGGCAVTPGSGRSDSRAALFFITGAIGLLVYRRKRALAALIMVAIGFSACGGLGKGEFLDPADRIGSYFDVAVDDDAFYIAAYDETAGDLAYARVATGDLSRPIAWRYVDGIDPTSVATVEDGYRRGIARNDVGPDIGMYPSIGRSSAGDISIAYYDASNRALKFAQGRGSFQTHSIQTPGGKESIGLYPSIALSSGGLPVVAYVATGISAGDQRFKSELRLASAQIANPSLPEHWQVSVVDSVPVSCAGLCGNREACLLDEMVDGAPNTNKLFSSCVAKDTQACPVECMDGEACINQVCTPILDAPPAVGFVEGTGLFAHALYGKSGLTIAYYDHSYGLAKLAQQSPGGAFRVSVVDGTPSVTDVGPFISMAETTDGSLHVAYTDALHHRLLYKIISAGAIPDVAEVVDDGMRPDGHHWVGAGAHLRATGSSIEIVYQDQQSSDLRLATRQAAWSTRVLREGNAGFGFAPRLLTQRGASFLADFVYDQEANQVPLGTFLLTALP